MSPLGPLDGEKSYQWDIFINICHRLNEMSPIHVKKCRPYEKKVANRKNFQILEKRLCPFVHKSPILLFFCLFMLHVNLLLPLSQKHTAQFWLAFASVATKCCSWQSFIRHKLVLFHKLKRNAMASISNFRQYRQLKCSTM